MKKKEFRVLVRQVRKAIWFIVRRTGQRMIEARCKEYCEAKPPLPNSKQRLKVLSKISSLIRCKDKVLLIGGATAELG